MKRFKVEKVGDEYILSEVGGTYSEKCTIFYEKKTNKNHVKLPKDNPSGRTYIRQEKVDLGPVEFEEKTEFRTGLSSGGWRSKMTEDERIEVENLEKRLNEIKSLCQSRKVEKLDPNSEEGIKAAIEKLNAKLAKLKKA